MTLPNFTLFPHFIALFAISALVLLLGRKLYALRHKTQAKDPNMARQDINLEPQSLSIAELVTGLQNKWDKTISQKPIKFTAFCANDIPDKILCDPRLLTQIIEGLLSHAYENTHKGRIHLHIISHNISVYHAKITVTLADTGMGMSLEARENLLTPAPAQDKTKWVFDPTQSAETLSLLYVVNMAKALGDDVKINSKINRGTEINYSFVAKTASQPIAGASTDLPDWLSKVKPGQMVEMQLDDNLEVRKANISDPNSDIRDNSSPQKALPRIPRSCSTARPSAQEDYPELLQKNILIVEDSASNQQTIQALLEPLSPNIVFACNGSEALAVLRNHIFDIILMDIHMPRLNGIETTQIIRERELGAQYTPIIALSADTTPQTHSEAINAGMDGMLTKPVTMQALFEAMKNAHIKAKNLRSQTKTPDPKYSAGS